jgi:parvulin-like peptidyl-prolyl isomerase
MPLRPKMPRVIAAALVVISTFAAGYALQAHRQPTGPFVALVDGVPVTEDEVSVRLSDIMPLASYHGRIEGPRLVALRRAALDQLVLDALIYEEAVSQGRTAIAADLDAALAEVSGRFPSRHEYLQAMAEAGLTEREVRARHERRLVVRDATRAHEPRPVSEADITTYYGQNAGKFERPEQRHLVELLVRIDPADPASEERARKTAGDLAARAGDVEQLGTLARRHSQDDYRVKDGDMGFVHRGRLDEELDAAVFSAPLNTVTVARGFRGFTVFVVTENAPRRQLTLDEARPIIRERLTRQRHEAATKAWHTALLSSARIEVLDPALKDAKPAVLASVDAGTPPAGGTAPERSSH